MWIMLIFMKCFPEKMSYNLEDLRKYSLWRDFMTMFMTVFAVLR